jgi:hypothetical protein
MKNALFIVQAIKKGMLITDNLLPVEIIAELPAVPRNGSF